MADNSKQSFLNTLFQWTVKNTTNESESTTSETTTAECMNDDKRKWLEDALENITVNPIERIKLCIAKIKDTQTTDEQKQEFLDELCHWSEELDLAKDFFTIGGLDIVEPLLDNSNDDIRIKTCSLLAALVQNNAHCQRIIVQSGIQQKLLKILDESNNPDLKIKSVTAISALIRGYTLGQLQLQKYQGAKVLIRSLLLPIPRLQNKLCFLINTICGTSAHMKKYFFENGALEEFIRLFNMETCSDRQNTLETIVTLSSIKPDAIKTLSEHDSALVDEFKRKLDERYKIIQNSHDDQDEVNLINQSLQLISSPPSEIPPETTSTNQQLLSIS